MGGSTYIDSDTTTCVSLLFSYAVFNRLNLNFRCFQTQKMLITFAAVLGAQRSIWERVSPLVPQGISLSCQGNCSGHGLCLDDGSCRCDPEWSGKACTISACPFGCRGRGRCVAGGVSGLFACVCNQGFTGDACETAAAEPCPLHCSGNGFCLQPSRHEPAARCMCLHGWQGVACELDTCPDHCSSHGSCDGGTCRCHFGWEGLSCNTTLLVPSPPPSPPPAVALPPGMALLGCQDQRGCSGRGICLVNGKCDCNQGYLGDRCERVDEESLPCPADCSGHGICERGRCKCTLGYAGADCSGSACAEPGDATVGGCHGNGHCRCDAARHSCRCECSVSFTGPFCSKSTCPDACGSPTRGRCVAGKCECSPRWRGIGCAVEICPRGCSTPHGVCTNGVGVCGASWQGDACERSTCPGSPEPCSAHGECVEGRCECHAGWKGAECALNRTSTEALLECSREHCNGETHGRCSGGDVGSCICLSGWVGADCGESLCPDSCSGNGFCTDFGCSCYAGFSGNSCEVAECPKQCSGRGECQRGRCRCMFGWMGEDCSQQLSEYRQQTAPRIPV